MTNSWKDPTVPVRKYQKVLAVFITKDGTIRRTAEDQMARRIPNAVASYTVLPEEALQDQAKAKEWVQQNGFDGAVLMRPVALDKETNYVPGSGGYTVPAGYRSTWGYWGSGWGYAADPGHYTQDKVLYIETNVYSLSDDKLVWSSRTKTYNPSNVAKLVDEIVDESVAEMKKQNVIAGGA
ncbi:MAG TPA: hypothetical protein VEM14_03790 [Gemmatimonadaceae bacterium]|nr:hypothetical protein [Gemmatimonadaceae bacterium]